MADATVLPTYANNKFFLWNAKLTNSLDASTTDTTIYWDKIPEDSSGQITGSFLIAVKNTRRSPNNVELMWAPAASVSADGFSGTVVRGLDPSGLDYTTGSADYVYSFDSGDEVFCAILPQDGELIRAAMQGIIATGGNQLSVGDGTAGTKTYGVYTNAGFKGILRGTGALTEWSDDGVTWVSIADSIASVVFKVSADDTTPGYAEDKIVGDSSTIVFETQNDGGNETLRARTLYTASPAEINVLDGFTGDTADLNIVVNGSNADLQHTHSGLSVIQVTAGETLAVGDEVYINGLEQVTLTADQDAKVLASSPTTNFGGLSVVDIVLGAGATDVSRGFVHFDISGQPASVEKAYLRIFSAAIFNLAANTRKIQAYLPTGSWDESTVTWNNQPGVSATVANPAANFYTSYASGLGVYYDVTSIYNSSWNTNNYGLRLQWDNEATGSTYSTSFHSSEGASAQLRPQLFIFKEGTNYGKAYKTSSTATSVSVKGIVTSGGSAGDTVVVSVGGVIGGLSGLTPWALYKANTSGGLTLATDALDAQYIAVSATQVKVLDKRKEYATDVLSVTQSIGDLDIALTALPAGLILDNITVTSGSTTAYNQKGLFTAVATTPSSTTAASRGITAVDIL